MHQVIYIVKLNKFNFSNKEVEEFRQKSKNSEYENKRL